MDSIGSQADFREILIATFRDNQASAEFASARLQDSYIAQHYTRCAALYRHAVAHLEGGGRCHDLLERLRAELRLPQTLSEITNAPHSEALRNVLHDMTGLIAFAIEAGAD